MKSLVDFFESFLDKSNKSKNVSIDTALCIETGIDETTFHDHFIVRDKDTVILKESLNNRIGANIIMAKLIKGMMKLGLTTLATAIPRKNVSIGIQADFDIKGITFDLGGMGMKITTKNKIEDCVFDLQSVAFGDAPEVKNCDFRNTTLRTYNSYDENVLPTLVKCKGGKEFCWSLSLNARLLNNYVGKAKKHQQNRASLFKRLGDMPIRLVTGNRVALLWQTREPERMLGRDSQHLYNGEDSFRSVEDPNCHIMIAKL